LHQEIEALVMTEIIEVEEMMEKEGRIEVALTETYI
jgi:hypothetical protein